MIIASHNAIQVERQIFPPPISPLSKPRILLRYNVTGK